MEHFRYFDHTGGKHQWVDSQSMCMILDRVTGEPQRFGKAMLSIGTLKDAKSTCFRTPRSPSRCVIVMLDSIMSVPIEEEVTNGHS